MVYCTIMLVAHYLFDWFIQGWWIKDTSLNSALKRFHHLISALAIICALIVGSGYVTIVQTLALLEVPNLLSITRPLIQKMENKFIPRLNDLAFVLLFIILRTILLPYVTLKMIPMAFYNMNRNIGFIRNLCLLIVCFIYGMIVVINVYWYVVLL